MILCWASPCMQVICLSDLSLFNINLGITDERTQSVVSLTEIQVFWLASKNNTTQHFPTCKWINLQSIEDAHAGYTSKIQTGIILFWKKSVKNGDKLVKTSVENWWKNWWQSDEKIGDKIDGKIGGKLVESWGNPKVWRTCGRTNIWHVLEILAHLKTASEMHVGI